MIDEEKRRAAGLGYSLATRRWFCDVDEFREFAHALLRRTIAPQEFDTDALWVELRAAFEADRVETLER